MRNTVHYLPFPISARLRPRPDCVSSSLCRCPAATILFCFCTTIGIFTAYHGGIFDDNFWAQTAITSDLIDEGSFPRNASIGSTAFNFKFGLLNANAQPFASILNKLGLSDDKITTEDFDNVSLNDVEIVTAWSMNHHAEAVRLCKNILQYDELLNKTHLRLISYNLGDVPPSVVDSFLRSCSIAKMRTFNFTGLPPYIRDLLQYRWKPLIIADVLRDSKAVLWIDSSTMFIKDAVSLQDIFEREAKEHQGVWLFDQTYHSIAAATNPLMYKYFPMAEQQAISMDMWGANMMLWIGRTNVKVEIMKPFVECALIEDCMSPPGSELRCVFPAGNARLYANCHRYDQAAINLILALRSGLNASKYTISNSVLKARRL